MDKKLVFRGGDSKSEAPEKAPPYNPANDPGYQEAVKILESLKPGFDKAAHKMTAKEIMATMPALQKNLINSQKTAPVAAPTANWGAINNWKSVPQAPSFNPVYAPVYKGGLFNGPQTVDPASLQTPAQNFVYLAGLLGSQNQNGGSK